MRYFTKAGRSLPALLLALVLLLGMAPVSAENAVYLDSGCSSIRKLTAEEIAHLLEDNPAEISVSPDAMFDIPASVTAPYAPGKVNGTFLQQAVNRLSALRAIAGLPAVSLDSALNESAQYGAVLLSASEFSHTPPQPGDMDGDFYARGREATSSSNIFYWSSSDPSSRFVYSVDSFMDDSDAYNIDSLGHRRWQLNPTLGKVGYGYAVAGPQQYVTEKVFDRSGSADDYDFIGWPASGYFPTGLFAGNAAWSVTLNPEKYSAPSLSEVTVTLTRESDGRVWRFTAAAADGFFNVDTSGYGVSNCMIFRPEGIDQYGGVYTVSVGGLKNRFGGAVDFAYRVEFFSVADIAPTEATFPDLPLTHWASADVERMVRLGVITGYEDGTFRPDLQVTLAEFSKMLCVAFYEDRPGYRPWWWGYVETVHLHGLLNSLSVEPTINFEDRNYYGDGGVNVDLARYDMARMMYNLLLDRGAALPSAAAREAAMAGIGDRDAVPARYRDAVSVCYALRLLYGIDGNFSGEAGMTRAQACAVLSRLLNT